MKPSGKDEPLRPFVKGKHIDEPGMIRKIMAELYVDKASSDVTFLVENQLFTAHRAILAVRSPVFSTMLFGRSFKESIQLDHTISLPNKTARAFETFLKYLYTCFIDLTNLELDTVTETLFMAHEYDVGGLVSSLVNCLQEIIDLETIFKIYDSALLLNDRNLLSRCRLFAFDNAAEMLKSPKFCSLSKVAVIDLISKDPFYASEIDILFAVNSWHEHHQGVDMRDILRKIRFQLLRLDGMTLTDVAGIYEMLAANGIDMKVFGNKFGQNPSKPRVLKPEKNNVATEAKGASISGINQAFISLILSKGITNFGTSLRLGASLTVVLAKVHAVGSLAFSITAQGYSCGYKIKTSTDNSSWERLACIRSGKFCGVQLLIFSTRRVKFIKITGYLLDTPGSSSMYRPTNYGISSFECPSEAASRSMFRMFQKRCPNGGTLIFQASPDSPHIALDEFGNYTDS